MSIRVGPRFVQIMSSTVTDEESDREYLYGLDKEGVVWFYHTKKAEWLELSGQSMGEDLLNEPIMNLDEFREKWGKDGEVLWAMVKEFIESCALFPDRATFAIRLEIATKDVLAAIRGIK